jgi:hypothetical protein
MTDDQLLFVILLTGSVCLLIWAVESVRSANRKLERYLDEWQADIDDE